MNDLVEFLRARLDDDEAIAIRTVDINVRADMKRGKTTAPRWLPEPETSGVWDERDVKRVHHTWVAEREHIVRHDPARVLAEVDAKRRIIAWVEEQQVPNSTIGDDFIFPLYALADVYDQHPDYDESWRA